jgi:hypothetical protein
MPTSHSALQGQKKLGDEAERRKFIYVMLVIVVLVIIWQFLGSL